MPIDGCTHTFSHLVTHVLPKYMATMRRRMTTPIPMADFATLPKRELLSRLGEQTEFSGCYVLLDGKNPIYAGISRKVVSRLRQHVKGKTHNNASLAYLMAREGLDEKRHRAKWMQDDSFIGRFAAAQARIRDMNVAAIRIDCPVELYAFELYCSMELDTEKWNTFRTH